MCRKSVTEGSAYTVNEAILAGDVIDDVLTQEHFLKIAKVLRPKGDQERLDLRCTCNEGKGMRVSEAQAFSERFGAQRVAVDRDGLPQ
jgi:hypothetical protein